MGSFSDLTCKYPLPDQWANEYFQTYDFGGGIEGYLITKEGLLFRENRSFKMEVFPFSGRINIGCEDENKDWRSYIIFFENGSLTSITARERNDHSD